MWAQQCADHTGKHTHIIHGRCLITIFSPWPLLLEPSQAFELILPQSRVRFISSLFVCRVCPRGLPSPCPSACLPCRRELSYFGVKVAMIEPGYFNTDVTNPEKISRTTLEAWDRLSPEVKELYGEKFLASGE